MKIKICGMKYQENIKKVAALQPDYLGFIFYDKSKRNYKGEVFKTFNTIKKVGVFVNATQKFILEKVIKHQLNAVQLHGDESWEFCEKMQSKNLEVIKVFSVGDTFDFSILKPYETACDYFLFDTKGKERGGNGTIFNWNVLKMYPSKKPYFLSGGIGLENVEDLLLFLKSESAKYCCGLDVNSKFEIKPGLKNVDSLKIFTQKFKN